MTETLRNDDERKRAARKRDVERKFEDFISDLDLEGFSTISAHRAGQRDLSSDIPDDHNSPTMYGPVDYAMPGEISHETVHPLLKDVLESLPLEPDKRLARISELQQQISSCLATEVVQKMGGENASMIALDMEKFWAVIEFAIVHAFIVGDALKDVFDEHESSNIAVTETMAAYLKDALQFLGTNPSTWPKNARADLVRAITDILLQWGKRLDDDE